jgi:hypothetical protein
MKNARHYGRPLVAKVQGGQLLIAIGIQTLAHAVTYADWANRWDDERQDYIRSFAIIDAQAFAEEVIYAMLREREDGSTPLSDFLDKMAEAAVDDGSMACEYGQCIKYGETSSHEKWALGLNSEDPHP